ncbi:MAG: valine--tRNA ligase, partial [Candidatus Omnitrophota bacterium]
YNPNEMENDIYRSWEDEGLFHARLDRNKAPYTIMIPPPNITGILHMGHALNNTIQDILIRYNRMRGREALWMPGTDHAGIATQNVVERKLSKQGISRHQLGREGFMREVWKWRDEYGDTIIRQLRRLGASCDWPRQRFTMDEGLSDAVQEVFIRLYEKGLIYRGNYIINWCPRCQTALSDEEVEHEEIEGKLYYIKYRVQPDNPARETSIPGYLIVATTRPETMLGDTALAINPNDKRYKSLAGRSAIVPIAGRRIPIIEDDMVDPVFGTGVVKITPAHDPNDFNAGKRHNLREINIMGPDGVLNDNAGIYKGMDRFKARQELAGRLEREGQLEKVTAHRHAVGHCYRCHTIVEPYLSKQWFVKMKPLAGPAIAAVENGSIRFHPPRWKKVYLDWMYNIRDWCISRQIWWGHRLPVYYCKECALDDSSSKGIIVSRSMPDKCPHCGGKNIIQDEDVLDTWFSSWLWPFSTFGWPFNACINEGKVSSRDIDRQRQEFAYFYPTSCLVTAQEIIFFWVARMIMAGLEFCKNIPFQDVYIHGTVRDDTGTKMSKSLGNTIDPIEIIERYGADALRFSIISITAAGQDVFLNKERFEAGRAFANKLWNASRFILMNFKPQAECCLEDYFKADGFSLADKWIWASFQRAVKAVEKAMEDYRFNDAANIIYDFVWHKYCDWYVETAKTNIDQPGTQVVLFNILINCLKILHPFMPFVTEAVWRQMGMERPLMISEWPRVCGKTVDDEAIDRMDKFINIIAAVRNIRAQMNIPFKRPVDIIISTLDKAMLLSPDELSVYARKLANAGRVEVSMLKSGQGSGASAVLDFCDVFVPLEGIVDIGKEKSRLEKDLSEAEIFLKAINKKLENKSFIDKAPDSVVHDERRKALVQTDKIARIKENIKNLR